MEYLDIVDKNNNLTGRVETREKAHEESLYHRHANIWIFNENKEILLQKRAMNKKTNPGMWAKTGGHVDSGETVIEGLVREVYEEIGLKVTEDTVTEIEVMRFDGIKSNHFSHEYYTITNLGLDEFSLNDGEVDELKYMKISDLEKEVESKNMEYVFSKWKYEDFKSKMEYFKKELSI